MRPFLFVCFQILGPLIPYAFQKSRRNHASIASVRLIILNVTKEIMESACTRSDSMCHPKPWVAHSVRDLHYAADDSGKRAKTAPGFHVPPKALGGTFNFSDNPQLAGMPTDRPGKSVEFKRDNM